MTRLFFILSLLTLHTLSALTFKDKLLNGAIGDYIITEQNKFCSLIRIHSTSTEKLVIEEISFPESALPKDVNQWLASGAKGNTSWSFIEINPKTSTLTSLFSLTKNAWLVPNADDSFFFKILDIPLSQISESDRRRIGPSPKEGPDTRKIWNPTLIFEGKKIDSPQFAAYRIEMPKDGSILSGKRIELFFNKKDETFPFPLWGQITDDSNAALKFRVIDSGKNLPSPKKPPL
jgi:hypothetical protein